MAEVLSDRRALAQDRERPPPIAILLHRSAPSIFMRVQNCELAATHSWMTLFLSHLSRTADLVRCLLRAISRATDQRFMHRANIVSPGPGVQTLPSNIERAAFCKDHAIFRDSRRKLQILSTKHRYRCCRVRVGPRENSVLSA